MLPVVVVGGSTTAISVQRLVVRLGHPVFAACPADSWSAKTKHYRPLPATSLGQWRGELGESGYSHLRELPFARAVVIPTSDNSALWLSKLPQDLCDRYLVCVSETPIMLLLQDKGEFAELAAEHGIACPSSFPVATRDELQEFPFTSSGMYFFKPLDSQSFSRRFGCKALPFSGKESALRAWDEYALGSAGVLIQEYVPGGADRHYFIDGFRDRHGEVIARLARRRIRMHPSDFGNSTLCESIGIDAVRAAWSSLGSLLDTIAYRGIFSAEFKHDARDDSFRLIEINTRPWIYIQFADECGVNMCELYIRDALEEDTPPMGEVDTGKYCINLLGDFHALRSMPASTRPSMASVLAVWFKAFKMLFDWRDLRPAASSIFDTLRSWARHFR